MRVKPTDDPSRAIVRDHVTKAVIPADGIEVPDFDPYWLRRLRDGDVVLVTAETETPAQKAADEAEAAAQDAEKAAARAEAAAKPVPVTPVSAPATLAASPAAAAPKAQS